MRLLAMQSRWQAVEQGFGSMRVYRGSGGGRIVTAEQRGNDLHRFAAADVQAICLCFPTYSHEMSRAA